MNPNPSVASGTPPMNRNVNLDDIVNYSSPSRPSRLTVPSSSSSSNSSSSSSSTQTLAFSTVLPVTPQITLPSSTTTNAPVSTNGSIVPNGLSGDNIELYIEKRPFLSLFSIVNKDGVGLHSRNSDNNGNTNGNNYNGGADGGTIYSDDEHKIFLVKPKPHAQIYSTRPSSSSFTSSTSTVVPLSSAASVPSVSVTSVSSDSTASSTNAGNTTGSTNTTTTITTPSSSVSPSESLSSSKLFVVKKIVTIENSVRAKHLIKEATVMSALLNRPNQTPNDHILKFVTFVANECRINLSNEFLSNNVDFIGNNDYEEQDEGDHQHGTGHPSNPRQSTDTVTGYVPSSHEYYGDFSYQDYPEETPLDEYYRALAETEREMDLNDEDNDWTRSENGQTWINMTAGLSFTKTDYHRFGRTNPKPITITTTVSTPPPNHYSNSNSTSTKKVSFQRTETNVTTTDTTATRTTTLRPVKIMKYYLVMEFARGGDLSRWMLYALHNWKRADDDKEKYSSHSHHLASLYPINQRRNLSRAFVHLYEIRTKSIAWQTLTALDYMHGTNTNDPPSPLNNHPNHSSGRHRFIHRDIKPDNLFVRDAFALDQVDLREIPRYPKHFYIYVRPPNSQRRVNFTDTVIYDPFDGLAKNDEYAPKQEDSNSISPNAEMRPYILVADFDRSKITLPNENVRDFFQTNADTSKGKEDFLPPDYHAAKPCGADIMNSFRSGCGTDIWALGLSLILVHFTGIECNIGGDKPDIIGPKTFFNFCTELRQTMAPFAKELWRRESSAFRTDGLTKVSTTGNVIQSPEIVSTPLPPLRASSESSMLTGIDDSTNNDDDDDDDDDDDNVNPEDNQSGFFPNDTVLLRHTSSGQSLTPNAKNHRHTNAYTLGQSTPPAPSTMNDQPLRGQPVKIKLDALVKLFRDYSSQNDVPMPTIEFIRFIRSMLRCDAWGTPVCTANKILTNSFLDAVRPNSSGRVTNKDDWDDINDLGKHTVLKDLRKGDRIPPELPLLFHDLYRLGNLQVGVGFCLTLNAFRENSFALQQGNDKLNLRKHQLSLRYGPKLGTEVVVKWYRRDTMKEQDAHHLHKRQLDRRIVDRSGKPLNHQHIATVYAIFQQEFARIIPSTTGTGTNVPTTSLTSTNVNVPRTVTNATGNETTSSLTGHPSLLVVMKKAAGGPFDQWLLRRGRDIALHHVEALKGSSAKLHRQDPSVLPQLVNIYAGPRLTATIIGQLLRTVRYMHQEGQVQTDIRLYALFLANHPYELDNLPLESEATYPENANNIENHRSVRVRLELPSSLPSLTSLLAQILRRKLNKVLSDVTDNDERKMIIDSNQLDGVPKIALQTKVFRSTGTATPSTGSSVPSSNPRLYRLPYTPPSADLPKEAYVPETINDPTDFTAFLPSTVKLSSVLPQLLLSPVNVMKSYDAYFYRDEFRLFTEAEKESPAMDVWAIGEIMFNMLRGYTIRAASLSSTQMESNLEWRKSIHRSEQEITDDSNKGQPQSLYDPLSIVDSLRQYDPVEHGSTIDFITHTVLNNPWFRDFDCSRYEEEDEANEQRRIVRRKLGRNIAVEVNTKDGTILDDCLTVTEIELEHEILKTLGIVNKPLYLDTLLTTTDTTTASSSTSRESSGTHVFLRGTHNPSVPLPEIESPVTLLRILIRERTALETVRGMNRLFLWINVLWVTIGLGMLARKDFVDAWFARHRTTSYVLTTLSVSISNLVGLPLYRDPNDYDIGGRAVFFMIVICLIKGYLYTIRTSTSRAINVLSGTIAARTLAGSTSALHQVLYGEDITFTFGQSLVASSPFLTTLVGKLIPSSVYQLFVSAVNDVQQIVFAYLLSTTIYNTLVLTDAINTTIVISSDSILLIAIYCVLLYFPSLLWGTSETTVRAGLRALWLPNYIDRRYWLPTYIRYTQALLGVTVVPLLLTYFTFLLTSLVPYLKGVMANNAGSPSEWLNRTVGNATLFVNTTTGTSGNVSANATVESIVPIADETSSSTSMNNLILCLPVSSICLLRNALDDEHSDSWIYGIMGLFSFGNLVYYLLLGKYLIPVPSPRKVWK